MLPATRIRRPSPRAFRRLVALCLAGGAHVKFQIPRDANSFWITAKSDQALGVCFGLRQYPRQPAKNRSPQTAQHLVARPRAVGDARVYNYDGNIAAEAGVEQVGPELSLGEDQHPGLECCDVGANGPRQVERAIEDAFGSKARSRQLLAGAGSGGDEDAVAGKGGFDLLHEAADGEDLADRNGVQPDDRLFSHSGDLEPPRYLAQALGKPLTILLRGHHPPKPPRRAGDQGRQKREVIEKENHARRNSPSPGLTLK